MVNRVDSVISMGETEIQALERFVSENDELLALEEQIGRFNIFDSLGIARVEIRHSNFLAWLLTPAESHGLGDLFLKAVLMDVLRKARQQGVPPPVSPVELDGADLQQVEIRREWRNIDLLIVSQSPSFVIAIENKVDSGEHSGQLQRYEETIARELPGRRRLFVFLTPDGDDPSDEDWIAYSYADLHQTLTRTRRVNVGAIGVEVGTFLDHYLSLIRSRFMESAEIDKLCRQIYTNHRQALDLIFERTGSGSLNLVRQMKDWMQTRPEWTILSDKRREIAFAPANWATQLPQIGRKTHRHGNWINASMSVHGDTSLRLYVIVRPTVDKALRRAAIDRLLQDKSEFGFKRGSKGKELTDDWTKLFTEDICSLPDGEDTSFEAIKPAIETRLHELAEQFSRVPAALSALPGFDEL